MFPSRVLLGLAVLLVETSAFSVSHGFLRSPAVITSLQHRSKLLNKPTIPIKSPLFMSTEPTESDDIVVPTPEESKEIQDTKKKTGLSLIPLFIKFCVVLAVKFITDILVFPPLLLWRITRLTIKQVLKLLGKSSPESSGGNASA